MNIPIGMKVIDGAIKNPDEVIRAIEQHYPFSRSVVGKERVVDDIRTSETTYLPFLAYNNPEPIHAMNKAVWHELDKYAKDAGTGFRAVEDVSVNRYEPGQFYGIHTDYGYGSHRVISALVYLNTVDDGGETYFDKFDLAIKPVAGRLLIFPSNYLFSHEARATVDSVKVSAAYWAQG
jgi:hypothetical protein